MNQVPVTLMYRKRISLPNVPSASEIDFRIENLSTQSYVNQVYIFVGDSLLFNMQ